MIIELYGLPGSGKTYTARQLEHSFGHTRIRLNHKFRILFLFVVFIMTKPLLSLRLFFLYWRKVTDIYSLWNLIIFRHAKYQLAFMLSKKGHDVILDEGPIQNILSLPELFSLKDMQQLIALYESEDNKYILFNIDEQQRTEWLQKRNFSNEIQFERGPAWFKTAKRTNKTFLELMKPQQNVFFVNEEVSIADLGELLKVK